MEKPDRTDTCQEPRKHPQHMCELLRLGLMEERDKRAVKPTVRCAKCGARADEAGSVCQPLEL